MSKVVDNLPGVGLSRDRPEPLYYQIEIDLRRALERGELAETQWPTEEELTRRYGVSRMTVRAALRRLEDDGLIERRRGRGTFPRPAAAKIVRHPARLLGFEDDLLRQGATPRLELLGAEAVAPPADLAAALRLTNGQAVWRVRRRGLVDDEPLWLELRYCPLEAAARLSGADLLGRSFNSLLGEALGTRVTAARLRVEATVANRHQARQLDVRPGHPLLVNRLVLFDTAGRPLGATWAAFRADRYAFSFDLAAEADWQGFKVHLEGRECGVLGPES